jgi:hypothetical protein
MTRLDAVLALSTFFLLTSHAFEWDDSDSVPEVHFDDKPLRPIEALKLQRRSQPQWLFFISSELVDSNSTVLQEWEFVSHILITPEQCYQIAEIIQMLDDALQRANPTVSNITSSAYRLGQEDCDEDDQCPCEEEADEGETRRRVLISHRLLEAKTRSNAPGLKAPLEYPLRVASFSTH